MAGTVSGRRVDTKGCASPSRNLSMGDAARSTGGTAAEKGRAATPMRREGSEGRSDRKSGFGGGKRKRCLGHGDIGGRTAGGASSATHGFVARRLGRLAISPPDLIGRSCLHMRCLPRKDGAQEFNLVHIVVCFGENLALFCGCL